MKVNFLGWYGKNNCGDEAFKLAHAEMFPQVRCVYTSDHCLQGFDHLVLGGGDVIKKMYLDYIQDRPFYVLGAGLGYESEIELLKGMKVKGAVFRNQADVMLAKAAGIEAMYSPDIVFAVDCPKHKERKTIKKKKMVVILTDSVNPSTIEKHPKELNYAEFMKYELGQVLSDMGQWYEIEFLPFSDQVFDHDVKMHLDVRNRMKKPRAAKVTRDTPTPLEAMRIISEADLVITMKFHGVVFSIMTGTPFVNIGLSRKTQKLCKDSRLGHLCVDAYALTYDRVVEAIKEAEAKGVSEMLLEDAHAKRTRVLETANFVAANWFN